MVAAELILPVGSVLIGLFASAIGARLGLIDHPLQAHKTHKTPTPLVGGLAVVLPLVTYLTIILWKHPGSSGLAVLNFAAISAFVLGGVDDRWGLPSYFRLLSSALIAIAAMLIVPEFVVAHFDFTFLSQPLLLAPFGVGFTILVVAGLMNAINMSDGVNGLTCGLSLIWVAFLLCYAPSELTPLFNLLALCLLVTLIFNLRGRLFLGNSGSYALGMTIALLTIYVYNRAGGALPADTVVAWFIIPVLDCLRLIAVRTSKRLSPMTADQEHFHHRLQRVMPTELSVILYWGLVAMPGVASMALPAVTLPSVLGVIAIYVWLLLWSTKPRVEPEGEAVTARLNDRSRPPAGVE